MRIAVVLFCSVLIGLAVKAPVYGDLVVFKVPTTKITFVLQGKAITSRTQPTINFTHISKQVFDLPNTGDTTVITVPTPNQIGQKRLVKSKGDEAGIREATVWCLDHGLLTEFHRGIDQLGAINASDPLVTEVKRLKGELAKPLGDTAAVEAELMKDYGGSSGKVVKTGHFLLVHNGEKPDKAEIKRKKPEQRAEQLEQLLELFIMKCAERGLPVQVPAQPLKVAVVNIVPKKLTAGDLRTAPLDKNIFWSTNQNLLLIDERSEMPMLKAVKKLQSDVTKQASNTKPKRPGGAYGSGAAAPMSSGSMTGGSDSLLSSLSAGQLSKLTITLASLMQIGVENYELESTSREAAYMFLANCGVVSRATPRWVADGLAAQFEFPVEMGWWKIGDVGQLRNAWYQASLSDPDRFTITDIVTNGCYAEAATPNQSIRAGTQAWALTHFLLQTNPQGFAKYVASFQSIPFDVTMDEEVLGTVFDQAFEGDRTELESQWREYMTGLKADYLSLEAEEAGTTAEN